MDRNDDFLALEELVLADKSARTAAAENDLRRKLAEVIEGERSRRKLSIRALAERMETSVSQVQRLLHREVGGSLTLRTLVRAADALEMDLSLNMRPKVTSPATVIPFGKTAWATLGASPRGRTLPRGLRASPPGTRNVTEQAQTIAEA